jgi:hypothetical protein
MAASQLVVRWVVMSRGSSNVLLKKSLCPSYRGLCAWHLGSALHYPSELGGEPEVHHTVHAAAMTEPRMRSQ